MNHERLLTASLLVVLAVTATGAMAAQGEFSVARGEYLVVEVQGNGAVATDGDTVYVWASSASTIAVGPTPAKADRHFIYCLDIDGSEVWCDQGTLQHGERLEYQVDPGAVSTGRHRVRARIHEDGFGSDNPQQETLAFTLHVIRKQGDLDGDGLSNRDEVARSLGLRDRDTDSDGLTDGEEVTRYNTDPTEPDTDGDRLDDGTETERGTDPLSPHTDGDGLADGAERHEYDTDPTKTDTDGDGIGDGAELDRGSDPTDPSSPGAETDDSEATQEGENGGSTQDQTNSQAPASDETSAQTADEGVQRGFFTNDPDSSLAVLNDPFNLTTLGFVLSVFGILFDLRRGG